MIDHKLNPSIPRAALLLASTLAFALLASGCPSATGAKITLAGKVADNSAVQEFESLSSAQCDGVRSLRIYFQHASVGDNIYGGIKGLSESDAVKYALTTQQFQAGNQTDLNTWLGTHVGWADYYEDNPGWATKVSDFTANVQTHGTGSLVDVAMMKFCYIDQDASFATYRDAMVALQAAYPQVTFIWWTMPLCGLGDSNNVLRNAFNAQVRNYVAANGRYLYDIADIECHGPTGTVVSDEYGTALYGDYTPDGGHLNADGRDRAARAMWALLAKIAEDREAN